MCHHWPGPECRSELLEVPPDDVGHVPTVNNVRLGSDVNIIRRGPGIVLMLASRNGGDAHVTHTAVASDIFPCCAAYGLFAARTLHAHRYSRRKWP
jgi:hypothetical protein